MTETNSKLSPGSISIARECMDAANRIWAAREKGQYWSRSISRDERRSMQRAFDALERDRLAGKPIQRVQQLEVVPQAWTIQTGIDAARTDLTGCHEIEDLFGTPTRAALVEVCAQQLCGAFVMNGGKPMTPDEVVTELGLPLLSWWIYAHGHLFGAPSVFELHAGLAERLCETQPDVYGAQVRLPLPGLYLSLPPETSLRLRHEQSGWHRVSLIGVSESSVTEGPRKGRTLLCCVWGEPNVGSRSASDDTAQAIWISLPDDERISEREEAIWSEAQTQRQFSAVEWQGRVLPEQEGRRLLQRLIVNFLLYLSSPNPDVRPAHASARSKTWEEVAAEVEAAKSARTRPRIDPSKRRWQLWQAGQSVERLVVTARDILVRGHWRRQHYGPKFSLERTIWIQPHIRLPTGAEVAGHDYQVR